MYNCEMYWRNLGESAMTVINVLVSNQVFSPTTWKQ